MTVRARVRRDPNHTIRVWALSHDRVYKGDHFRLKHEGEWLQAHRASVLPRVYSVSRTSYEMERLVTPPWTLMDHKATLVQLFHNMNDVWRHGPENEFNPRTLDEYLAILLKNEPVPPLAKIAQHIEWDALNIGLIHGNAYLRNIMFREHSERLVLISPKGSSNVLPDMPSVDCGMMLASILGVDGTWIVDPQKLKDLIYDDNEWAATVFWCVVHLIDKLPQAASETARNILWQYIAKASELI